MLAYTLAHGTELGFSIVCYVCSFLEGLPDGHEARASGLATQSQGCSGNVLDAQAIFPNAATCVRSHLPQPTTAVDRREFKLLVVTDGVPKGLSLQKRITGEYPGFCQCVESCQQQHSKGWYSGVK